MEHAVIINDKTLPSIILHIVTWNSKIDILGAEVLTKIRRHFVIFYFNWEILLLYFDEGRNSSVGVATDNGLDGPGIESQ
jgi:hypothetical protein